MLARIKRPIPTKISTVPPVSASSEKGNVLGGLLRELLDRYRELPTYEQIRAVVGLAARLSEGSKEGQRRRVVAYRDGERFGTWVVGRGPKPYGVMVEIFCAFENGLYADQTVL